MSAHGFVRIAGSKMAKCLVAISVVAVLIMLLAVDVRRPPTDQFSTRAALGLINEYQVYVSARIPFVRCRYPESCSAYAKRVFRDYGFRRGLYLSFQRIQSCF